MFRLTRNFFYFIFCIPKKFGTGTETSSSLEYEDNVHHTHKKNDKQYFDINGNLRNV